MAAESSNKLRIGILTVSDRSASGQRGDLSGPALQEVIIQEGWLVEHLEIIPDETLIIQAKLVELVDKHNLDLVLTTGGTGFAPRDVTPEATLAVIERRAPGLEEAMRAESLKITPHAMLSRAVAGIRANTLIINFPGSPKAAIENLKFVLPVLAHAVDLLRDDPKSEAGH